MVTATAADDEVSAVAAEADDSEAEEDGVDSPDPDDVAVLEEADAPSDEGVPACDEEAVVACDEAVPACDDGAAAACDALESAVFSAESEFFVSPDEETVWDAGWGTEVDRGGMTARATTDVQTRTAQTPTVIVEEMRFDACLPRGFEGSSDEAAP